jgi:hypothetical protein
VAGEIRGELGGDETGAMDIRVVEPGAIGSRARRRRRAETTWLGSWTWTTSWDVISTA